MKTTKRFVGLCANEADVNALDKIVDAMRVHNRYATQSDAVRFALQAGLREITPRS